MADLHAPPGALLQFRKGGDVLLARALSAKSGKIVASGEDGKKVELTADRVLQAAGTVPTTLSDADAKLRLKEIRGHAEALMPSIELGLLWEQARESPDGGPIEDLAALYFGRSGSFEERLAFGFALCADKMHFRQKGERFVPRSAREVEEAIERKEHERRAAERRAALLAWIHDGLVRKHAETSDPPESAQAEIAALIDFAVKGEESEHLTRARTLMKEVDAGKGHGAPAYPPTADGAFELLVRLGIFDPHENLAIRRAGLPQRFAPALIEAAEAVPPYDPATPGVDGPPPSARRTLPAGVTAITIDDAETIDRDDAVSVEDLPGGGYLLGIHIADVAHFIARGAPLDEEAARRGTTAYLPRGKLPMFPPLLSEGRMSLDADGRPRPALSFWVTLAPDLSIVKDEIGESEIVVLKNATYEEIDAVIEGAPDPWGRTKLLDAIGAKLLERRLANGALDLKTPEIKVVVDDEGRVTLKKIETRSPARAHIAELMILANEVAARTCRDQGIPAVYRRQSAPSDPAPALEACPGPEVYAFEVRRRLGRTELGPTPGLHYTLGLDPYLQATSPIRRYQDLFAERQLKAWLRGAPLPYTHEDAQALAGSAEAAAGETAAAERESIQYWLYTWLLARRGEPLEAVVLFERDGKFMVELTDCAHRVFVKSRKRWAVGERIRVKVDGAHPRRGEITLSPVIEKAPVAVAPEAAATDAPAVEETASAIVQDATPS